MNTIEEKIVCDYAGHTFQELQELNIFEFWLYLHDAVIYNLQQTEEGQKYLEKCWMADQTEPDRDMLRKVFGKH